MFERIRCYRHLKKMEKFTRGAIVAGSLIGDDDMVKTANKTLSDILLIRKRMWTNKQLAKKYISETLKHGF